jgi:hypothetical protein
MKVWITKYALTQGIYEIEAEICKDINPDMIARANVNYSECYHGKGREWHLTKEDAIKRAESIKINKIESLRKQINKLENLQFE